MPGGRKKLITKRIPVRVDYPQMISDGRIIIENCSNCWHRTPDGIDVMACHILFHLFLQYQEDGKMPITSAITCNYKVETMAIKVETVLL